MVKIFQLSFSICLRSLITVKFRPHLLNSNEPEKRNPEVNILHKYFRQLAKTSHDNLIRNADCLLASSKDGRDNSAIAWVGPSKQRYGLTKFKLIY